MRRRIASLWFEHLALERALREGAQEGPFALYHHARNTERIYALNKAAQKRGVTLGMGLSDARALCPILVAQAADIEADQRFLSALARVAQRFCPWVGFDGGDGLLLDVTGSTHLWGGEQGFIDTARAVFGDFGLSVKIGIAPTIGAASALARFREGVCESPRAALQDLPIAALRLGEKDVTLLRRLGMRKIKDVWDMPRAALVRRVGPQVILRLDQALGAQGEPLSPIGPPRIFATRMRLPDPIGLLQDVMAVIARLLTPLCEKLEQHGMGARALALTLFRVDKHEEVLTIRFARPLRDANTLLPLIEYHIARIDAGYGFDGIRLEAQELHTQQAHTVGAYRKDEGYDDLLTRIGNRIGFENIRKIVPQDCHLPEKSYALVRYDAEDPAWSKVVASKGMRPMILFTPERITARGKTPPKTFHWRKLRFQTADVTGPERIAPLWWQDDPNWRTGVRDYWRIATREGRRLWMFYTPQHPAWYVHGEFP